MGEVKVWSHNVSLISYRLISLSFHVNGPPIPEIQHLKKWPWNSKIKAIAVGHKVGKTPYQLISLSFDVDDPRIPLYSYLKIWR